MVRFWFFAGALVAAIVLPLLFGFFDKYAAQDWVTLLGAAAALLVSMYTLLRNVDPKPHWSFSRVTRDESKPFNNRPITRTLFVTFRNEGPGDAEEVGSQVKGPGSREWTKPVFPIMTRGPNIVERHEYRRIRLVVRNDPETIPTGKYKVRLLYRYLPDTSKPRKKTFTISITDELTSFPNPESGS